MVTDDGTGSDSLCKRARKAQVRRERRRRNRTRRASRRLVESGEIPEEPCLLCGSEQRLTIHHVGSVMRADRFVFLCQRCHARAHQPVYRNVMVASGQFSIRPEAAIRRRGTHVARGELNHQDSKTPRKEQGGGPCPLDVGESMMGAQE